MMGHSYGQNVLVAALESFSSHGSQFDLHLNLSKCEIFWPSGDSFPEFPTSIKRISEALELLGSPIRGTTTFLTSICLFILPKLQLLRIASLF